VAAVETSDHPSWTVKWHDAGFQDPIEGAERNRAVDSEVPSGYVVNLLKPLQEVHFGVGGKDSDSLCCPAGCA